MNPSPRAARQRRRWRGLAVLALLLPLAGGARAQEAPLRFEHFSLEQGLSDYMVVALARDALGFVWVGTHGGLNRYDGVRIRTYTPRDGSGLGDSHIRALAQDAATPGAVWVATFGGELYRYDPGAEHFELVQETPGGRARALAGDGAGGVWAGTTGGGLLHVAHPEARPTVYRAALRPDALPSDTVTALLRGESGALWIGTAGGLARLDPATGALTAYRSRPGDPGALSHPAVSALAEVGGTLWCATADGTLHRFDPAVGRFTRFRPVTGVPIGALAVSAAHPGKLWVGTRGAGLLLVDGETGRATPIRAPGGPAERADVISLLEDETGVLWVGVQGGLYRADARGPRFVPVRRDPDAPAPLSATAVGALYVAPSEPDAVWVGTIRGGLNRHDLRTGAFRPYFNETGHSLNVVFALREDAAGDLWAGGPAPALYRVDRAAGTATPSPLPPGVGTVREIYEAPSRPGLWWLATSGGGLVGFDPIARVPVQTFGQASPLASNEVWTAIEAPDEPGVLWVGTHGDGLRRLDLASGTGERVHARGCTLSDRVVALAADADGVLWAGTYEEGLFRYDRRAGTCRQYTRDDGLAWDDIGGLYLDALGRLWITSSNGLTLYDPRRDVFTRFTREDGLQDNVFHYHARQQLPDGTLLLGGADGFNAFDPVRVRVDTTAPRVVLTRLYVNGRPRALTPDGNGGYRPLALAHNENDLRFEYAALDFRDPAKNAYRVRLEGAEAGWRSVGTEAAERYPLLAPGRYAFHVLGSNADGYWSAAALTIPFRIRPPWWQTWYFWTAVVLSVFGLVVSAYQYRLAQLRRLEATRQRIADDLHDDIGSKMSTVALRLDLVGRSAGVGEAERRHLADLAGTARGVVDDLRDAIWIVDAEHDDLPALAVRMEAFAEQILRGRSYAFRRDADLPAVPLPMEQRRHLYLLFKEALHNAVRHGQPDHVDVRLTCRGDRLSLVVADDGRGFDPATAARGRGLTTLQTRADALGGRLALESAPGRGTTLRLDLDLP